MPIDRAAAEELAREAMAALKRGDGLAAQQRFSRLVEGGHATTPMRLMLARACKMSGDQLAEVEALDRVLANDSENLSALLMRGNCSARSGDARGAASFYKAALAVAQRTSAPAELAAGLREAQRFLIAQADEFKRSLAKVGEKVHGEGESGIRLRHALDIVTGDREIFLQQPSVLYYPYLPQRQFFEREEFDWVPSLEAATREIKQELVALIEADAAFEPYVQPEKDRPPRDFHGLVGDPSWTALYLWKDGELVEENATRCPKTVAALENVPLTHISSRTPSVLFSRLLPGAHIPPHHGMLNSRLICHLPLIIPPECWLRVGNETRVWEEQKLLIFDDSIEHEAKNGSDQVRIVLLFDVWRPELSRDEREGISAIFKTIDQFQR